MSTLQFRKIRRTLFSFAMILSMLVLNLGVSSAVHAEASALDSAAQLNDYAIVFVSRQIPPKGSVYYQQGGSMPGVMPYSRFQVAAPGKLIVREVNGTLRTLVDGSNPTAASLNLGDVNAPDVSYDGKRIVFAGIPAGSHSNAPMTNPGAWRLYVINVDGTGLRQLTFSDQNVNLSQFNNLANRFTQYDDTDPVWLPDGRVAFSSTRWPSYGMYGAARTSNLYVVNADGSGLHRITTERNGADRPLVDPLTGKIVYSRWWRNLRVATDDMGTIPDPRGGYIMHNGLCAINSSGAQCFEPGGKFNMERNSWHLASINPDGTELAQFAGRSNSRFYGALVNHAYGGSFAADGTLYANFFPMTNGSEAAGFGGIRRYQRGPNGYTHIIGITTRDESVQQFVSTNPKSYGVYVGNYAGEPEALPDGRLVISWAQDATQDYGLYTINADGSGLTKLYDNPGTTELRARAIRSRPVPPIIPDKITQTASLLPPLEQGPYDTDGRFTFQALNVYFNAPVDVDIFNAMPVGSANTIRFFIDHQRSQQTGSIEAFDWPILLEEVVINPDGSVTARPPANVPLFEQIRSAQPGYDVPLTGSNAISFESGGAAHVAGENFGRPGDVQTCVGCHPGHTMISVPANPADAKWTNLATGAAVTVSSTGAGAASGINDRRVHLNVPKGTKRFWVSGSGSPNTQWVQLTFPVPVTVRTVRLYNPSSADSSVTVQDATVRLFSDAAGTQEIASNNSGPLSDRGTNVNFNEIVAKVVRIQFNSVNGNAAALGEVEVIARAEAPDSTGSATPTPGATQTQTPVVTPVLTATATFTPTPSTSDPFVSVESDLSNINVGEIALVSVKLNNVPVDGYQSAEFTCSYDATMLEKSNIATTDLFGTDAVAAIHDPQNGSFIVALAGSNGHKATASGTAFTFNVKGLQAGQSPIQCSARASKGDNIPVGIQSTGTTIVIGVVASPTPIDLPSATPTNSPEPTATAEPVGSPTPTPSPNGTISGKVIASKPVTVGLLDANGTVVTSTTTSSDGSFILTALAGDYIVAATASGFLSHAGHVTLTAGNTVERPTINLLAGDIDGNNVVDQFDALTIGMNYASSAPSAADLNNDGVIDFLDLELLAENYRKTGPTVWE
ncbi:MAG: hypothetical protein IT314_14830 [Anaerolineales bacterium]|nr:hypothetical protein [Anaerolineales bacterium]